jgi:hypothetical protein
MKINFLLNVNICGITANSSEFDTVVVTSDNSIVIFKNSIKEGLILMDNLMLM